MCGFPSYEDCGCCACYNYGERFDLGVPAVHCVVHAPILVFLCISYHTHIRKTFTEHEHEGRSCINRYWNACGGPRGMEWDYAKIRVLVRTQDRHTTEQQFVQVRSGRYAYADPFKKQSTLGHVGSAVCRGIRGSLTKSIFVGERSSAGFLFYYRVGVGSR